MERFARRLDIAAVGAGFVATAVFEILSSFCRIAGVSDFGLPLLIGSRLLGGGAAGAWALGMLLLLAAGGVTALIYLGLFRVLGVVGARFGALIGLGHWMVAGLLLGMVGPPTAAGMSRAPGFFAAAHGGSGVLELLALHVVFGAMVGRFCANAVARLGIQPFLGGAEKPTTPLADAGGQGQTTFESYKIKRGA